ncbi:MAG: hypothetical protein HUJ68_08560, partial [Clostridia bacterium]|nr:hypothetical protein [Clostridia bacterium]
MARTKYLPEEFEIVGDMSYNDIGKKFFNAISLNHNTLVTVIGFKKDYTSVIAVGTVFSVLLIAVVIFCVAKIIINKKRKITAYKKIQK